MALKKVKISSIKRSAHLRAKKTPLTKQQQQKRLQQQSNKDKQNIFSTKAGKRSKLVKRQKQISQTTVVEEENEEELLENVADMLEGEDLEYLQKRSNVKQRKRKHEMDGMEKESIGIEKTYTAESVKQNAQQKVEIGLLPIKSRDGQIIMRSREIDIQPKAKSAKLEDDAAEANCEQNEEEEEDQDSEYENSDEDIVNDENAPHQPEKRLISTTDLLIARQQEIERQKYRIGILCTGILEKPEEKMRNFNALFELMAETNGQDQANLLIVRKLAIISATEVFKDILPEYRVGQVDTKVQTVRKTTLSRVNFEKALLQQFKKFLQYLEQLTAAVTKRGQRRITPQSMRLAEVAVGSMCALLIAHPYFNYVQNVAQLLVYMLNSNFATMRDEIHKCFRAVFGADRRMDMSLFIVRRINHMIKTRMCNVYVECVTCLLTLNIKNVNLDAEKANELKQKKLESHRQNLLSLSKRERKRRKKLVQLNRELDETRAEENKQTKHRKMTEITKMIFTIYFRVLKNYPTSKVLSAVLEGLAEFAHVINVDFFTDLIELLNNILETMELGYREQLFCIQTIFVILSGQGEVLNIDPIRFYKHLYKNMMAVHAGKNHDDYRIILKTLDEVMVRRRRHINSARLLAFVKRLMTVSLHLLPHSILATLATIRTTIQASTALTDLLDTDYSIGSGRYNPDLDDPEYCNASSTSLYELTCLTHHYHPTVRTMAKHLINGSPPTGNEALPMELGKLTAMDFYEQYDSTQMAFKPTIAIPKPTPVRIKKGRLQFADVSFKGFYRSLIKARRKSTKGATMDVCFDFYRDLCRV